MATRREREQRTRRYTNAKEVAERDMSGSERDTLALPKGVSIFDFKKEGVYRLDVLPYEVGEGNPRADPGMFHYERRYYAHRRIGPNKESYVCLAKTYKKRCPLCEYLAKGEVSEDEYKDLKAKERQMIPVVDLDDPSKGVQIYEGPFFNGLGELISQDLELTEDDDPIIDFYHPNKWLTMKVNVKHESVGTGKFFKPVKIAFTPRKSGYDDAFLDTVPCLDDLIKRPTTEEIQEVLDGITGAGEDSMPAKRSAPVMDDDDDEDIPPPRGKAAKVVDEDDDDEDIPPPKRGSKASKEDDEEDEDDNDEDDDEDEDEDEDESGDEDEEEAIAPPKKAPKHRR